VISGPILSVPEFYKSCKVQIALKVIFLSVVLNLWVCNYAILSDRMYYSFFHPAC